jgi:ureidoacrylate peracid hydrolase
MKRDLKKETPRAGNLGRRKLIRLIGATAAASLVGGAGEQSASSEQTSAPIQKTKGRTTRIDAKPEPIAIDTAETAVIVVDMQNDFGSKGGMFDRAGIDISMIQRAVAPTARVLAAARKAGIRIVYLKMAFQPDLSDMGLCDSPNWRDHQWMGVGTAVHATNGTESRILVRDTWNTDIVSDLKPEPADTLIYKHRFSGFYETNLDRKLKDMGARYLIFTGCTTSVCVESTIRDAMFRDYSPLLLADCTDEPVGYGLPRSNHEASLCSLKRCSVGYRVRSNSSKPSNHPPYQRRRARRSAVDDSGRTAGSRK